MKRELLYNGKTNHIPGRTFPIRRGCRYCDRITCETVRRCGLSRAQEIPKVNVERQAHSPVKILIHLHGGAATPPQCFSNGRAKVSPNLYARGDCARPYCIGRRSLKRELLHNGKTNHIPGRALFPAREGCRLVDAANDAVDCGISFSHMREIP